MPKPFKERPSDETGEIRRQPRFQKTVPTQGSRNLAHNTPDSNARKSLQDFALPKISPLVVDKKLIKTGEDATTLRVMKENSLKALKKDLAAYKSVPNNPRRKELEAMAKNLQTTIHKITAFLNQWTNLTQDWYLDHLMRTDDPLAPQAKALLRFRDQHRGQDFTPQERNYHEVLAGRLRNALMERIREKQRGK